MILFMSSCFKQKPKKIESQTDVVQVERLNACTQMNLLQDLFEKGNIKAAFVCTEWNMSFPTLYQNISQVDVNLWNNLLMPLSTQVLNDKENLRRVIAVSQNLNSRNGLDDFGKVIGALSDVNFYDGLNSLFSCVDKDCIGRSKISKKDIMELIRIINILKDKNVEVHRLMSQLVKSLSVLDPSFSTNVARVLASPSFKSKRMNMIDLLVDFFTVEKSDFERQVIPRILKTENEADRDSVWSWMNSTDFGADLLRRLIVFNNEHPSAIKDLRSISQIKEMGLSCDSEVSAAFFINLDNHLLDLVNVFASKSTVEIETYLENDLLQHQIATQSCPNFKDIKIQLDGADYDLSVIRLKKSLIEAIKIPGVLSITKIVAKKISQTPGLNAKELSNLVSKYGEKNYLGSLEEFIRIVENESPNVLDQYESYFKSLPFNVFNDLASLLRYTLEKENHLSWMSFGQAWEFFNDQEKEFVFNYIDEHFSSKSDYKVLFSFYLELYTVFSEYLPRLITSWTSEQSINLTYNSLESVAKFFQGDKVLADFREFFSEKHLIKVIELFVNGEQLSQWANDVQALLPSSSLNNIKFEFNDSFSFSSLECLESIGDSSLSLLIKSFPSQCQAGDPSSLVEKIRLISDFSNHFEQANGYSLVKESNFLNRGFLQSVILMLKRSYVDLGSKDDLESYLSFQKRILNDESSYKILKTTKSITDNLSLENKITVQSKLLRSAALELSDNEKLKSKKSALLYLSEVHANNNWSPLIEMSYQEQDDRLSCENDLNRNIGGIQCASKEEFLRFAENFTSLLTRSNHDEMPIGIRQFLKALDPSEGLPIPLGSREPTLKNLSIKESLKMFYELSDRSKEVNTKVLEYETAEGSTNEKTTLMERIEVVIRDVNFDENYLGAHYKNSVSKAYDYNDVVESKYKLFNICVKAGFCGKFMNRSEKRMARNAVRAFPSLAEINLAPYEYGDYMKALLGAVVSSSSKASQISSIVKFKRNGDGFNIPWIQTKKQLRKHNGKILSELAGISAFSNMARWTRDRFGRDPQAFQNFLNGEKLNYINGNLLKNINKSVSDATLIALIESFSENDFEILADTHDFISGLSYQELLRLEDMVGDSLVLISRLTEDSKNFDFDRMFNFVSWVVSKYPEIKAQWKATDSLYETLIAYHPYLHFLAKSVIDGDQDLKVFVTDLYESVESLLLKNEKGLSLAEILKLEFDEPLAKELTEIVRSFTSLMKVLNIDTGTVQAKNLGAMATFLNKDVTEGFAHYLQMSSSKRACSYQGEIVFCQDNLHYLEPWKIVDLLAKDQDVWSRYVIGLVDSPRSISDWLSNSLNLIRIPEQQIGD